MEASPKRIHIKIKNNILELENVNRIFGQFIETNHIDQKIFSAVSLALDEILNNIISYGYNDEKEHQINIQISLLNEKIKVQIVDDALPFNPLDIKEADTKSSVEDRAIGGLGIHLIKKTADKLSYAYINKKNCLTLEKNI